MSTFANSGNHFRRNFSDSADAPPPQKGGIGIEPLMRP